MDDSDSGLQDEQVVNLAKGTLAYFLADDEQKEQIVELFKLLTKNIENHIPEGAKRKIFGKTLYGVQTSLTIENWLTQHIQEIISSDDYDALLTTLWPILVENIQNNSFRKCDKPDILKELALEWSHGKPFYELFEILKAVDARLIAGTQRRHFKLENIIDICENGLAYNGTLVLGAIAELMGILYPDENEELISNILILQKNLRYGLPSSTAITLYELGFADRIIAMELSSIMEDNLLIKKVALRKIKEQQEAIRELLKKYPSYFSVVFENLIA